MMQPMEVGLPGRGRGGLAATATCRDVSVLVGLGLLASMFTVHMIRVARSHPEILEPTAGQVGCCLCFSFMWLVWAMLRLLPSKAVETKVTGPGSHGIDSPIVVSASLGSNFPMLSTIQATALKYIDAAAEFGAIMALFWVCDRTPYFERSGKGYSRDFFWFLWSILILIGLASVRKCEQRAPSVTKGTGHGGVLSQIPEARHAKPLQRDQTEEWKGWMQVMFLLYHYFEAKELYNAIRLYIAAYVWMTGFGNFSYYYVKADFGLTRFCQMMWRLNFLCFFCCLVLQNEYMLYYICMLHTAFTVMIYATLGIKSTINTTTAGITSKFVAVTVVVLVIWHVPGMFDYFWWPWRWLVLYKDSMHEWHFRSTLDHLVWIVGMATAFFFPNMDAYLGQLEALPSRRRIFIKASVIALALLLTRVYYTAVFSLDKYSYNALHPYTSWLPITLYIVLRNISATARRYYMHFFAWLGKITLETYIAQYHIWMSTTGHGFTWESNASPKRLLRLLPPEYPLLNFLLLSGIYITISYRIFQCTVTLRAIATPSDRDALMWNLQRVPVALLAIYVFSRLLMVV